MKLYRIWQTAVDGWDTYDSAVVAAGDEEAARRTDPGGFREWSDEHGQWLFIYADGRKEPTGRTRSDWPSDIDAVSVQYLGEATEGIGAGVICASFNAG